MNSVNNSGELQPGDSIEAFVGLLSQSAWSLYEAGVMLYRLQANDPLIIQKIRAALPNVPAATFAGLLRVGEGSLHQALLLNNCAAYRKIRRLPYLVQKQLIDAGVVEVVVNDDTGDTLMRPLVDLEPAEVKQVFGKEGVRSKEEQLAWRKRRQVNTPKLLKSDASAWYVKKDRMYCTRPCELTKAQLLAALAEISG